MMLKPNIPNLTNNPVKNSQMRNAIETASPKIGGIANQAGSIAGQAGPAADKAGQIAGKAQSTIADARNKAAQAKAKAEEAKRKIEEGRAKVRAAQEKIKQTQERVNQLAQAQQAKIKAAQQQARNAKSFVSTVTVSPSSVIALVAPLFLPLITRFINIEKVASLIIDKLITETKRKLRDKGRVEVQGTFVTFYPKDQADYTKYKQQFDRKVSSLRKSINTLNQIADTALKILQVVRAILTVLQIAILIQNAKNKALGIAAAPDLAAPGWSKPVAALYPPNKEISESIIDKIKEKIPVFLAAITAITSFLQIFRRIISSLKIKVDMLKFDIIPNPLMQQIPNSATSDELYVGNVDQANANDTGTNSTEHTASTGKNYTIEVITTPSGALQAIAYDSFSRMKITQTAPSKFRKANELIDELKQILG